MVTLVLIFLGTIAVAAALIRIFGTVNDREWHHHERGPGEVVMRRRVEKRWEYREATPREQRDCMDMVAW